MAIARASSLPRRQVLADSVYEALLERLFDNSVEAGSPLNIDQLARDFDVSQTPIREALARLESTGLVVRTALKGYRVAAELSPEQLADLMDARGVLEPELARRAVAHSTDEFVAALRETIEQLATAPTGPSFAEYHSYWEADERFHEMIARQADNAFLHRAFESLGGQAQRFRQFAGLGVSDAEFAIAEHQKVLDAIEAGDADDAQAAMARHIMNVRERALADARGRS
jgi:Transcriptional regulators